MEPRNKKAYSNSSTICTIQFHHSYWLKYCIYEKKLLI